MEKQPQTWTEEAWPSTCSGHPLNNYSPPGYIYEAFIFSQRPSENQAIGIEYRQQPQKEPSSIRDYPYTSLQAHQTASKRKFPSHSSCITRVSVIVH